MPQQNWWDTRDISAITKALIERGARRVAVKTREELIRDACIVLDADKLIEVGMTDQQPIFEEGDKVRVLTDMSGEDQDGVEHDLSAAMLASIEATVETVRFVPGGDQGWQYNVVIPVRQGEVDEDGDAFRIDGNFDDTDRDENGDMPLAVFIP